MQNQDPLNPMDNAQVTSQMAQINTVSGIDKLNTTVAGLNGQLVQLQALQGATLVGRDVTVAGDRLAVVDGRASAASSSSSAGRQRQGRDPQRRRPRRRQPEPGRLGQRAATASSGPPATVQDGDGYRFRVSASSGTASVLGGTLMRDQVESVSSAGNSLNLQLRHSGDVPYDTVKAFN